MYKILSKCYNTTKGKDIKISKLGHSTNEFVGFVVNSATHSLSLSKVSISDETKMDYLIKLLANKENLKNPEKLDGLLQKMKKMKNP